LNVKPLLPDGILEMIEY